MAKYKTALLSFGGYHEEAILAAEKAVELKPSESTYWQQKGKTCQRAGRIVEGRDAFLRASELDSKSSSTWRDLGKVYMELETHQLALRAFNRSIDLGGDHDYVESWIGRAAALRKLGRYQETLLAYDRIVAIDPANFETWFNKSGLLKKLSQYDLALDAAVRAENLHPNSAEVQTAKCESLIELARGLADENLWSEALQACERAISLDSSHSIAWSQRGTIFMMTGKFEEALESIEGAIRLRPERVEEWWHKGQVLLKLAEQQQTTGTDLAYSVEYRAAMWWLCRAWHKRSRLSDDGAAVRKTFQQIGYDPRQCLTSYPSTAF